MFLFIVACAVSVKARYIRAAFCNYTSIILTYPLYTSTLTCHKPICPSFSLISIKIIQEYLYIYYLLPKTHLLRVGLPSCNPPNVKQVILLISARGNSETPVPFSLLEFRLYFATCSLPPAVTVSKPTPPKPLLVGSDCMECWVFLYACLRFI